MKRHFPAIGVRRGEHPTIHFPKGHSMLANLLERISLQQIECEMNSFRRRCSAAGLASLLFLFSVTDLPACACCSDPGEYTLRTDDVGEYQVAQIQDMVFARTAKLYLTDAGEEENAKGMSDVSTSYQLSSVVEPKQWRLTFKAKGKTGVLTLPFPPTMTAYAADIHDGKKSSGNGPLLYKEWRFEGSATGDGIFQEGFASPARYTLVLQGRGNRCDNGTDFKHWRLEVSGEKAGYAFFGELVAGSR